MEPDYKYLRAWCIMQGSFEEWTEREIERAKRDKAPETAVYQDKDGRWVTFEEVNSHTAKKRVSAIVQRLEDHEERG